MTSGSETAPALDLQSIGPEPVSWGVVPETRRVVCADAETQAWLDAEFDRYERECRVTLGSEVASMAAAVSKGEQPSSVLHHLVMYGRSDIPSIAGYCGLTIDPAESTISQLGYLGVVERHEAADELDFPTYTLDMFAISRLLSGSPEANRQ